MKKRVTVGIQFLELFAAALREDEMARIAVTGRDRVFAIGGFVIAIMTTETAIPIFVTNIIRVSTPVSLHLGKEILAINGLRLRDERIGLRRIRIGRPQ